MTILYILLAAFCLLALSALIGLAKAKHIVDSAKYLIDEERSK